MNTVRSLLEEHLLCDRHYHDETEIQKISHAMTAALNGQGSSLPMLPTYLAVSNRIEEEKPVIVLDAGGTNLRVALVTIRDREMIQTYFAKYPMPGTQGPLSKEAFFDAVAEKILPLCEKSGVISFCFSYNTEPLEDHDAIVTSLCKEVEIDGIAGAHVCAELAGALKRFGVEREFEFYLLNDSVASVLGGISELDPDVRYDGEIGLIWGTGFNICYSEDTENIRTAFSYPFDRMLVNTEAGDYDGFCQGALDLALDLGSMQPGLHKTEKMIGGAYLGELIVGGLRACAERGLLPPSYLEVERLDLREVDRILSEGTTDQLPIRSEAELETVEQIIGAVYRRAARLVAYMLTAVAERIRGNRPDAKVAVIADGSTLLKSSCLLKSLKEHCDTLCKPRGLTIDLIPSSQAIMKGTACAALLKSNQGYSLQR